MTDRPAMDERCSSGPESTTGSNQLGDPFPSPPPSPAEGMSACALVEAILSAEHRFAVISLGSDVPIEVGADGLLHVEDKDINRIYKKLSLRIHPDKLKDCADAGAAFAKLSKARASIKKGRGLLDSDDEEDGVTSASGAFGPPLHRANAGHERCALRSTPLLASQIPISTTQVPRRATTRQATAVMSMLLLPLEL